MTIQSPFDLPPDCPYCRRPLEVSRRFPAPVPHQEVQMLLCAVCSYATARTVGVPGTHPAGWHAVIPWL